MLTLPSHHVGVAPRPSPIRVPLFRLGAQSRLVLAEARPPVQFVFVLRFAAAGGPLLASRAGVCAVVGWWLLVVAIYLLNGLSDVTADRANGSTRPLASGVLPQRAAWAWCGAAALAGLALCGLVSPELLMLAVAMTALGWGYSQGPAWKNRPLGSAVVIGCGAALTYGAGAAAAGRLDASHMVSFAALGVWVSTCCLSKDFSDVDGDRLAGRRTLPVVLGPRAASRLVALLALLAGAGILATSAVLGIDLLVAGLFAAGSIAVAARVISTGSAHGRGDRRQSYRAYMWTQYAANAVMLCSGLA